MQGVLHVVRLLVVNPNQSMGIKVVNPCHSPWELKYTIIICCRARADKITSACPFVLPQHVAHHPVGD